MNTQKMFKSIASEVQIFNNIEKKEQFLFVLGALFSRIISLKKASEIMEIEPEFFLELLDLLELRFSYLSEQDVTVEKNW